MRQTARHGRPPPSAASWCARFLSTTPADRRLLWSVGFGPTRAWWRLVERIVARGIVSHWMCRKREIDRLVREAADHAFTQLIVVGAGLDALAWRCSSESLYESIIIADHPATLGVIRDALAALGDSPASVAEVERVDLLALDLAHQDARDTTESSRRYDPTAPTVIVIEGVLMYLPEETVAGVLESLASLECPRLRLIASWMVDHPGRPIGFPTHSSLVTSWLRRRQEPMLWASTRGRLGAFLSSLGWHPTAFIDPSEDDSGGHPGDRGLSGEHIVVAEGGAGHRRATSP